MDSALAFSMEGAARTDEPGALLSHVWSPGWNSNQSLHKFQAEIGGDLRGGTAGVRLLEDLDMPAPTPADLPQAFAPRPGELLLQGRHQVYGSDELARLSPGLAQLAGRARLYLHPEDAARLELDGGDGAEVAGQALEVVVDASQTPGSAGFSVGYPETLALRSGRWASVGHAENWQRAPELIHSDRSETP